MEPTEGSKSRLTSLADFRSIKRKEKYVRACMEKAAVVRDLLHTAQVQFNKSADREKTVIAFALNDLLRTISKDDLDNFRDVLRNALHGQP